MPGKVMYMSREITSHKVNGLNEAISIEAVDGPGAGNASHVYSIAHYTKPFDPEPRVQTMDCLIHFQNGPINESGVNGISNEALIAIVIDRLQGFQSGDFKCRENDIALTHLEDAQHWLQHRTRARVQRGVEGTSKV